MVNKRRDKMRVAVLVCTFLMPIKLWAAADLIFLPAPTVANGDKVYLSPARHSNAGSRGECTSLGGNENTSAYASALVIANLSIEGLLARGYEVRVGGGTYTTAWQRSNLWEANAHIPLHSNARTENCNNSNASSHGAVIIYQSNNGSDLSDDILEYVEDVTPGTNDFTCHVTSTCTAYNSLAELDQTTAVAAYVEREFHTWDQGALYLKSGEDSGLIAGGIDTYLDWQRFLLWWNTWGWGGR